MRGCAIDTFRRKSALRERYTELSRDLKEGDMNTGGLHGARPDTGDLLWDPDRIDDDVLARFFMTCHPVLSREAGIPLTLRALGGLTSDEIARAFLVPTATVQARITRAKKTWRRPASGSRCRPRRTGMPGCPPS
ncbi:sigma factor-like helix-turn-helix DNA-binding protein [Kribbella turkmenica]|uniref:sigma factor-like helix-turn-helix DNA-binding protein n=1 Tax=Kribbella turkmenica TaxID=2530375 RepID=UPI00192D32D4|nr:sigma factor-like helix-turn-helix DNA-binding protein [Kribbella turkmenica]